MYYQAINYSLELSGDEADNYSNLSYNFLINIYMVEGNLTKVKELLKQSREICYMNQKKGIPSNVELIMNYFSRIKYYQKIGNHRKATKLNAKAAKLYAEYELSNEAKTSKLNMYNNLGLLFHSEGNYEKAEEMYSNSLDKDFKNYGSMAHPDIIKTYLNLGQVYLDSRNYTEAEKIYHQCLDLCKKLYDNLPHPEIILIYHSLSILYKDKREYKIAEEFLNLALQQNFQVYGNRGTLDSSKFLNELGYLHYAQMNFEQANKCCSKALQLNLQLLKGKPNLSTAPIYHNLGLIFSMDNSENINNFVVMFKKCEEIQIKFYGTIYHPAIANNYSKWGSIYHARGNLREAEEILEKSVKIYSKVNPGIYNKEEISLELDMVKKTKIKMEITKKTGIRLYLKFYQAIRTVKLLNNTSLPAKREFMKYFSKLGKFILSIYILYINI